MPEIGLPLMVQKMKNEKPPTPPIAQQSSISELALLFLKLGVTAFGGPAAHIAMMEEEVVRRRQWLTHTEFLDMLGVTNLIPGPNSTEMAIHIGFQRAGIHGLFVAGICFIVPAVIIVICIAWAYQHYGKLPAAEGLLYGIKPVVIAIVVQALWRLGKAAIKSQFLACIAISAIVLGFMGTPELVILFGGAAVAAATAWISASLKGTRGGVALIGLSGLCLSNRSVWAATTGGAAATTAAATQSLLWPIFLIFLKTGSVLFGSGYVLLAFLRADFVEKLGWLTETQLLDATAVGQITPGPLFTTATFTGYLMAGLPGAVVATVGIFLPAFFFVAISAPFIPRLRQSILAGRVLDGLNAASIALMLVVTWQLGRAAIFDLPTAIIAGIAAFILLRYSVNSVWLILSGAVSGLLIMSL